MHGQRDTEHRLVMPFVSVASVGGPFDDAAYVAGWRAGQLAGVLERLPAAEDLHFQARDEDVPQMDLIAMRHHRRLHAGASVDGWVPICIRAVPKGDPP